jgi:hypothetical protein
MMYETVCTRIKLKPGSVERVREWAAEINRRSDEALSTLRDEGVVVESAFLDSSDEGDFLVYYMKAKDMSRAREVARNSTHAIDKFHRGVMREICESGQGLELLLDLDRIGETRDEGSRQGMKDEGALEGMRDEG